MFNPQLPPGSPVGNALLLVLAKSVKFRPTDDLVGLPTSKATRQVFSHFGFDAERVNVGAAGCTQTARIRAVRNAFNKKGMLSNLPRGFWGLNQKGVQAAATLFPEEHLKYQGNLTRNWLAKQLADGKTYNKLRIALLSRYSVSAKCGFIDDHINTWLRRVIQRDGLRSRILAGEPIYPSHLVIWCLRSAQNDMRGLATNPVGRAMYGARTETERKTGKSPKEAANTASLAYQGDSEDDSQLGYDIVCPSPSPEQKVMGDMTFTFMRDALRAYLRKTRPARTIDRDHNILDHIIYGHRIAEVAEEFNLSKSRANSLVGEIRRSLRIARQAGSLGF